MLLKQWRKLFFSICFCLIIFSCAMSKEDYLYNYERFIKEVQANYTDYTPRDWVKADRRFNHFNNTLMKRFGNKLTMEEEIRVSYARVIYDSYRYGTELFDEINVISDSLKDGLENYIDNHLSDDVDFLLEQGVKIGDILNESIDKFSQGNK